MLNLSAQGPKGPPAFHQSRLENPDSTAASNSPPCLHWPLGLVGQVVRDSSEEGEAGTGSPNTWELTLE